VRGDEHDVDVRTHRHEPVVQVEAGHAAEVHVEHEAHRLAAGGRREVFVRRGEGLHAKSRGAQHPCER
jgi:hypothetical protein